MIALRAASAGGALALACAAPVLAAEAPSASTAAFGARTFGVLLLAHGGSSAWNRSVLEVRSSLGSKVPVEVAFGMADRREMQRAVDRLIARRVKKIVAVPLFVSSHSEVMEQTKFVLGLRKDPSPEFMQAPHSHQEHAVARRVDLKAPVALSPALDEHPLVAEILADRAKELSRKPSKEAVVLVGHGPVKDADDELWLRAMGALAKSVLKSGGYASVHAATLRDDAPPAVRQKAERQLRDLVSSLSRQGRVLVVPHLIAPGGIERKVRKALDGLFYGWTGRTLLPDPRVGRWVSLMVEATAGLPDMRRHKDAGRPLPPPERKRVLAAEAAPRAVKP